MQQHLLKLKKIIYKIFITVKNHALHGLRNQLDVILRSL